MEYAFAELRMFIETNYRMYSPVIPSEKEKAISEIKKMISEKSGITVDGEKRGLVIRLGEILFDYDSYSIKRKLKEIFQ